MQEPKEGHAENEMIEKDHRRAAKKEKSGGDWEAPRNRKKTNQIWLVNLDNSNVRSVLIEQYLREVLHLVTLMSNAINDF